MAAAASHSLSICCCRLPFSFLSGRSVRFLTTAARRLIAVPAGAAKPVLWPRLGEAAPVLGFSCGRSSRKRSRGRWSWSCTTGGASDMGVGETVQLSDGERAIFDKLLATLRHNQLDTVLRVAGGWVRDKLLGKDSTDIDIALDNMLGSRFCEMVNEYLESNGEPTHEYAVIKSNPEQSKHLEAAHMRLNGMAIDFVNLRAESYSDNTRIPTMIFGTAEEDAYRRDLTINSLFYNINAGAVEDLTGRGMQDLKNGIIATPLPPLSTFLDDPLRVLRAIRFGARFGFELTEELKKAAGSGEVKLALANKISRERIGTEIDLMLKGNNHVRAMNELADLQLFPVVFAAPLKTDPLITEDFGRLCVEHLRELSDVLEGFGPLKLNLLQRRICLFSGLLFPLRHVVSHDTKGKPIPLSRTILKESLKLKVKDAEEVLALHNAADSFHKISSLLCGEEETQEKAHVDRGNLRTKAGLIVREMKELWRPALLLSSLLMKEPIVTGLENASVVELEENFMSLEERVKRCLSMEKHILSMGLDKIWEAKPLLDGREVMSLLGLNKGGPQVKEWVDRMVRWQLAHPSGTAEDCRDWIKQETAKRQKFF